MFTTDDMICLSIFVVCLGACLLIKITDSRFVRHRNKFFAVTFSVIVLIFAALAWHLPSMDASTH